GHEVLHRTARAPLAGSQSDPRAILTGWGPPDLGPRRTPPRCSRVGRPSRRSTGRPDELGRQAARDQPMYWLTRLLVCGLAILFAASGVRKAADRDSGPWQVAHGVVRIVFGSSVVVGALWSAVRRRETG